MVARVRDSIDRQGMMATLGVELAAIERGRVEMTLRYDDRFTQKLRAVATRRSARCRAADSSRMVSARN
jgi:acyl-coenzyme A thioesterase PaaI-like protein